MAILGAVCSAAPDARLSIAFVDQILPHSFSADTVTIFTLKMIYLNGVFCLNGMRSVYKVVVIKMTHQIPVKLMTS
jgi:hypothetical protein